MRPDSKKPIVAISMGDPAGIGPEIIVKALMGRALREKARPLVVGDAWTIGKALEWCGMEGEVRSVSSLRECDFGPGIVNVLDARNVDQGSFEHGVVRPAYGRAAYEYVARAVSLAEKGEADAIATAPIHKESLKAANVPYVGHTEILAGLTGVEDPLTMFETRALRVFFFTRHLSLRDAIGHVKKERLLPFIERCCAALELLGDGQGRRGRSGESKAVAVAGLNPHCGEGGLFGDEEIEEISPAVREARRRGLHVEGPVGADSVFHLAMTGRFSAVVSLYHDQGHIAAKTLDFERTVSVTIGLPFLRTSVDHGTAFDIAGKGLASEVSMVEAVLAAARYAPHYGGGSRS